MSKVVLPKSTTQPSTTLDAQNVVVNGVSLTETIADLISQNVGDDVQIAGCAKLAENNIFTSTQTMPSLVVPSSISASSSVISLSKLPRLDTTITPSDPNDLVTVQYCTDNSTPDIRPLNNLWTGNNTFNKGITIKDPLNGQCFLFDESNNPVFTKDTTITGNLSIGQLYSPNLPYIATNKSNTANDLNLVQKVYVDNSINTLKTTPLTIPYLPLISSYQAGGNNENCLIQRKYVVDYFDSLLRGDLTFGGSQKIRNVETTGDPILRLYNDQDPSSVSNIKFYVKTNAIVNPIVGNSEITMTFDRFNSTGDTNNGVLNICPTGLDSTGIKMSRNSTTIYGNVIFDKIPKLLSDLSYNSDDMQIVNKKYVDSVVNTNNLKYQKTFQTEYFVGLDTLFTNCMRAPKLSDSSVNTHTFFLNAPTNLFEVRTCNISFNYFIQKANPIPIATPTDIYEYNTVGINSQNPASNSNQIKKRTAFSSTTAVSTFGQTLNSDNTFSITILNNSIIVTNLNSTKSLWTNPTISVAGSSRTGQSVFTPTSLTNYNNQAVPTFNPVNFTYVSANKIRIQVQYPQQINSPVVSGWISGFGFSSEIYLGNKINGTNSGWFFSDA